MGWEYEFYLAESKSLLDNTAVLLAAKKIGINNAVRIAHAHRQCSNMKVNFITHIFLSSKESGEYPDDLFEPRREDDLHRAKSCLSGAENRLVASKVQVSIGRVLHNNQSVHARGFRLRCNIFSIWLSTTGGGGGGRYLGGRICGLSRAAVLSPTKSFSDPCCNIQHGAL